MCTDNLQNKMKKVETICFLTKHVLFFSRLLPQKATDYWRDAFRTKINNI